MRLWGRICMAVGVLCLPFAFVSYIWFESLYVIGLSRPIGTIFPYRGYAIPLLLLGVVLFIVGLVLWGHEKEEGYQSQQEKQNVLGDITEE